MLFRTDPGLNCFNLSTDLLCGAYQNKKTVFYFVKTKLFQKEVEMSRATLIWDFCFILKQWMSFSNLKHIYRIPAKQGPNLKFVAEANHKPLLPKLNNRRSKKLMVRGPSIQPQRKYWSKYWSKHKYNQSLKYILRIVSTKRPQWATDWVRSKKY